MKQVVLLIFVLVFHLEALKYEDIQSGILPSKQICGRQHITIDRTAQVNEYPWLVYIPLKPRRPNIYANLRCAGALISKRYVITEKSCLQFYLTKVHLGQYDTSKNVTCTSSKCEPVIEIEVEERVIDETLGVILLRLAKDVEFTEYIQPICLPFEGFRRAETGRTVYSSGWGLTNLQEQQSLVKKRVVETVSSLSDCQKIYNADDNLLCVKVKDDSVEKPCNGDEGSPVMNNVDGRWILEGVLSWVFDSSLDPCAIKDPARATRISDEVLQWIVRNVRP